MTTVWIPGKPVPQGSLRPIRTAAGLRAIHAPALIDYRNRLATELQHNTHGPPLDGPVLVDITVRLARPAGHYGTGSNSNKVKPGAPPWPTTQRTGDADKLARVVLDACTIAGVWHDDSQVVELHVVKRWTTGTQQPGITVTISGTTT